MFDHALSMRLSTIFDLLDEGKAAPEGTEVTRKDGRIFKKLSGKWVYQRRAKDAAAEQAKVDAEERLGFAVAALSDTKKAKTADEAAFAARRAKAHAETAEYFARLTPNAKHAMKHAKKARAVADKALAHAKKFKEKADARAHKVEERAAAKLGLKPRTPDTDKFLKDVEAPAANMNALSAYTTGGDISDFKIKIGKHPKAPFFLKLLAEGAGTKRLFEAYHSYLNGREIPAAYTLEARKRRPKDKRTLYKESFEDAEDHLSHYLDKAENKKLSPALKAAASWYTRQGDQNMNRFLRGMPDNDGKSGQSAAAQMIPILDTYTRANKLDHDILLYRGFTVNEAALKKMIKPGAVYKDPGYMSTSTEKSIARSFARQNADSSNKKVILHIEAPKGSHAAYITPHSKFENESEFLIARGSSLTTVEHWEEDGFTHVRVRLETPTSHPKPPAPPSGAEGLDLRVVAADHGGVVGAY